MNKMRPKSCSVHFCGISEGVGMQQGPAASCVRASLQIGHMEVCHWHTSVIFASLALVRFQTAHQTSDALLSCRAALLIA